VLRNRAVFPATVARLIRRARAHFSRNLVSGQNQASPPDRMDPRLSAPDPHCHAGHFSPYSDGEPQGRPQRRPLIAKVGDWRKPASDSAQSPHYGGEDAARQAAGQHPANAAGKSHPEANFLAKKRRHRRGAQGGQASANCCPTANTYSRPIKSALPYLMTCPSLFLAGDLSSSLWR